jgi:hypothetical protein
MHKLRKLHVEVEVRPFQRANVELSSEPQVSYANLGDPILLRTRESARSLVGLAARATIRLQNFLAQAKRLWRDLDQFVFGDELDRLL